MGELLLIGTIASGVGLAFVTSKMGIRFIVDTIPMKQPKG